MADQKISQLTALTATASGDELPIVDTSATETKRITIESLFQGIPVNVGIGIGTASSVVPLHVRGTGAGTVASFTRTDFGGGSTVAMGASGGDPQLRFDRNGDIWSIGNHSGVFAIERSNNLAATGTGLYLSATGGVGVGVPVPTGGSRLEIGNGTVVGEFIPNGTANFIIGTDTNHPLLFRTNNATAITLDTIQNVGVGTPLPGSRLDVQGGALTVQEHIQASEQATIANGATHLFDSSAVMQANNGDCENSKYLLLNSNGAMGRVAEFFADTNATLDAGSGASVSFGDTVEPASGDVRVWTNNNGYINVKNNTGNPVIFVLTRIGAA